LDINPTFGVFFMANSTIKHVDLLTSDLSRWTAPQAAQ
jgi:hypothetical protein